MGGFLFKEGMYYSFKAQRGQAKTTRVIKVELYKVTFCHCKCKPKSIQWLLVKKWQIDYIDTICSMAWVLPSILWGRFQKHINLFVLFVLVLRKEKKTQWQKTPITCLLKELEAKVCFHWIGHQILHKNAIKTAPYWFAIKWR